MKKLSLYIIIGLLGFSCSKEFLDKGRLGQDTPKTTFSSEEGVTTAIRGAYAPLTNTSYILEYQRVMTQADDLMGQGGTTPYSAFTVTGSNTSNIWGGLWDVVSRTNNIINNFQDPVAGVSEDFRTATLAEMKTLRAYAYFTLVRFFGGVPIITNLTPQEFFNLPRNSVDEVYQQIVQDLEEALVEPSFSTDQSTKSWHLNKVSAQGLMVKAYAQWSGVYQANGSVTQNTDRWIQALDYAKGTAANCPVDFTDGSLLVSGNEYGEMFQAAGENCKESLFEAQIDPGIDFGNRIAQFTAPPSWVSFVITQNAYDIYSTTDARRGLSVISVDEWVDTTGEDRPAQAGRTGYYLGKIIWGSMDDFNQFSSWAASGYNMRLLRVADIILLAAEAEVRVNGPSATGDGYVNLIRQRANTYALSVGETGTPVPNLTNATVDTILDERRRELMGEQQRWFDLMRTGQMQTVTQNGYQTVATNLAGFNYETFDSRLGTLEISGTDSSVVFKMNPFDAAKLHVLPIPPNDVDNSKNPGFTQNPGY